MSGPCAKKTTPDGQHLLCVGGEDHHLRLPFLLALGRSGFRVSAAGTGDPAPFARAGVPYYRFHFERFLNPFADVAGVGQIGAIIDHLGPDLVQTFDTKPNLLVPLAARSRKGFRIVRTINGMGWVHSSRSPLALALRPVQRALHRLADQTTDATVFQNRQDKAAFERAHLVRHGRSELIAGSGVDIASFERASQSGASPEELRATLGLGQAEVVMTVTRLTRQKGIPTLLKAAALLHRAKPDLRILLVGPRESEGRLAVSAEEIERHSPYVIATGARPDIASLLHIAHVFVFPTEYREGVPRALMEAALAGLPIVATDLPGCNDVIRDGWSGWLVPPRSPRMLAERILRMLREPAAAREMGRRAAEHVRCGFSLELVVQRYRDLYLDLLAGSRTSPATESPAIEGKLRPCAE